MVKEMLIADGQIMMPSMLMQTRTWKRITTPMNCLFISNVRFIGISAVGEVDVCNKMMLWNNYKLRTKLT